MNGGLILILLAIVPFIVGDNDATLFPTAFAQSSINVTSVTPCFLNYTATGLEMMQNCRFDTDYLDAVTVSFDWVTGGLFPMILVSILIIMTYLKYQTGIYPIAIGVMFLPFAAWAYPDAFISYALAIAAVIGGGAVINAIIKQTKEY